MKEILSWTAIETKAEIEAKNVSIPEVIAAHLARIEVCEPDLGAVVAPLAEQAMERARTLEAEKAAGPLLGLPVTIKVNVDMKGEANTNGLPALKDNIATENAPIVENLLNAGAIPIGRTNTPEFSLRWFTSNPLYGITKNPVAPERTPGGSSGGASAAVAAGMGVLGHGNDLGGSLRYPAYCCGLATLRPSMGRVPAFNASAPEERPAMLQMMSVQGVIARSFADMKLAHGPISRGDLRDPLWNSAATSAHMRESKLRIGLAADPFGEQVAPEITAALAKAADIFRANGAEVIEVDPPHARETTEIWGRMLNTETDVMAREGMNAVGSQEVLSVLDGYLDFFGVNDLKSMLKDQARRLTIQRAWNQMFQSVDALLMPVSGALPFLLDQDFRDRDSLPDIVRAQRHLFLANVLGLPATSVPTGLAAGVPTGVQIITPWREDDLALDLSHMLERDLGGPARPAGL